jgi:hypothetical protein
VRVEFVDGNIYLSATVDIKAGLLFNPKQHTCTYGELPNFISDKIALLRLAGRGVYVDGMGKWRGENLYYVEVLPRQWNQTYGTSI